MKNESLFFLNDLENILFIQKYFIIKISNIILE